MEQPADPDSCPCFALDLGTPEVTALCPTQWTFDYEIFSGPSCSGARLNPDPPPVLSPTRLVCYDASALRQRIHPNQSVDTDLSPGANTNHVLCLTCSAITRDSDPAPSERYDCGCTTATGAGSGCTCSSLGVTGTPPTLPSTCTFANTACEITCSSPPSP